MSEASRNRLEVYSLRVNLALKILVLLLVVVLATYPSLVAGRLKAFTRVLADAGISKVTLPLFDVEIEADDLDDAQAAMNEILSEVEDLKVRHAEMIGLLSCQSGGNCTEKETQRVAEIVGGENGQPGETRIADKLQAAVIAAGKLADQSRPQADQTVWAVVVGADKTVESARDELARLIRNNFDGEILERRGYFRTVATFASSDDAKRSIDAISRIMGRDVYVVDLGNWCQPLAAGDSGVRTCAL